VAGPGRGPRALRLCRAAAFAWTAIALVALLLSLQRGWDGGVAGAAGTIASAAAFPAVLAYALFGAGTSRPRSLLALILNLLVLAGIAVFVVAMLRDIPALPREEPVVFAFLLALLALQLAITAASALAWRGAAAAR
jgi:hypothetical protein